jgi:hypothetical protein
MVAVSLLVVLTAFVNVALTVLQHSINESSEPVSHGGNGFRSAQSSTEAPILRAKISAATHQGDGGHAQCRSNAIDDAPRPPA